MRPRVCLRGGTARYAAAMAQPDFTPYERYLISMYKAGVGSSQWFTWLLIRGAALLFFFGLATRT